MKKQSLLTIICILIGVIGYAQKLKISVENDTIIVNGSPYGIIERKGDILSSDYVVKSLDGKEQIMFQFNEYNDPQKINSGNSNGRVTYYEVTFLNTTAKCEIPPFGFSIKSGIAKSVVQNHLLNGNAVDPDAEKKYIAVNGSKFSERKSELAAPKVIILGK